METTNKIANDEFHSVEFMRQVRSELSEEYLKDRQKYLAYLKKVMEDFKVQQKAHR